MKRLKKLFTKEQKITSVFEIDCLYNNDYEIRTVYEEITPKINWRLKVNDYVIISENKSLLNRSFTIVKKGELPNYKVVWIIELYRYIIAVRTNIDEFEYKRYRWE